MTLQQLYSFEIAKNKSVGGAHPCFVIAECGQNHNGDINIAMSMIKQAAHIIKADCVKFQKSDLKAKFTQNALKRPYQSEHSFGATYGEHKLFLEFTREQYAFLQQYAANENILFTASAMDKESLEFLAHLDVPFFKIGSGDCNNYPLLKQVAAKHKPVIVSTGMQDLDVVDEIYSIITALNPRLGLLHCVSAYPTPYSDINLKVLEMYSKRYTLSVIGYSGHEIGTEISVAAVAIGAKILERHFTLDKTMKGTDHSASLETNEFKTLVSQIRNVETAMSGSGIKARCDSELACYRKLGKSIVAAKNLTKGDVISAECLAIKVAEPFGIEAHDFAKLIGKQVRRSVLYDETLHFADLE